MTGFPADYLFSLFVASHRLDWPVCRLPVTPGAVTRRKPEAPAGSGREKPNGRSYRFGAVAYSVAGIPAYRSRPVRDHTDFVQPGRAHTVVQAQLTNGGRPAER